MGHGATSKSARRRANKKKADEKAGKGKGPLPKPSLLDRQWIRMLILPLLLMVLATTRGWFVGETASPKMDCCTTMQQAHRSVESAELRHLPGGTCPMLHRCRLPLRGSGPSSKTQLPQQLLPCANPLRLPVGDHHRVPMWKIIIGQPSTLSPSIRRQKLQYHSM